MLLNLIEIIVHGRRNQVFAKRNRFLCQRYYHSFFYIKSVKKFPESRDVQPHCKGWGFVELYFYRYKSLKGFFDQEIHFEAVVSANEIDVRSATLMEKQFDRLLYRIVFEQGLRHRTI